MEIRERKVTVREIAEGYIDSNVEGVRGFGGRLDIRPQYQREFIYKEEQRDEVIRTVYKGFPLNVMYWVDRGEEVEASGLPRYEVMDGQQRTISLCEYVAGSFSVFFPGSAWSEMQFYNLPSDIQKKILDYELFVYVCSGTDSEKLEWFKIINIAGEELTPQEIRNAVYAGAWVTDAKRYFSKPGCPASKVAGDYLKGSSIRQEFLETAIYWAASKEGKSIEAYMAEHSKDPLAQGLWSYFNSVIDWVKAVFPKTRKEMKGLPWGILYNERRSRTDLDPAALEERISELLADDDVTRASCVYEYLLTGDERKLSIRQFDKRTAAAAYEKQGRKCAICGKEFPFEERLSRPHHAVVQGRAYNARQLPDALRGLQLEEGCAGAERELLASHQHVVHLPAKFAYRASRKNNLSCAALCPNRPIS